MSNDNMVRDNATDRDFIIVSNTAEGWLQNVRSFIKQGGRPQPLAQPRQPMLGTPPPRKAAGKAGPGPEDALTGKLIDSLDASDELREMLECVVDDGLGDGGEEGEEECAVLVLMDSPDMDARDLAAVREWSSSADGTDSDDDSWMPLNADKTFLQPTGTLTDATEEPVAMVPPEVAVMPLSSSLPPQTAALQEQQQQQQPGPASPAAEAGAGSSKPQASTAGQPAPAPMKAQSPKAAGAQQKGTGGAAAGGAKLDSLLGRAGRSRVNDLLADLDLD